MSNIDPIRLTEIFKTLAASRSQQSSRNSATKPDSPTIDVRKNDSLRDKDKLKERLRLRLSKLKLESPSFEEEAPLVTIHEVLLWEFGDNILDHPDFKYVTETVCETMEINPALKNSMDALISELVK